MKRLLSVILQLPLATLVGAAVGVLAALVAAILSIGPLEEATYPLAPFALAPLPAVLGAWIDWLRLWRPTGRTIFWSSAALGLTALATLDAVIGRLFDGNVSSLALGPALPLAMALAVALGARALLGLARPGGTALGFSLLEGVVRRDETERLVLDTPVGVLELDRRHPDLGPKRLLDLSIGARVTVLGRLRQKISDGDPFRSERRSEASLLLGAARSVRDLRAMVWGRARAWAAYLALLALAATALSFAVTYAPNATEVPRARGMVMAKWR